MLSFFKTSLVGQYIFVFLLSMIPLVELRGAVPFADGFLKNDTGFLICDF